MKRPQAADPTFSERSSEQFGPTYFDPKEGSNAHPPGYYNYNRYEQRRTYHPQRYEPSHDFDYAPPLDEYPLHTDCFDYPSARVPYPPSYSSPTLSPQNPRAAPPSYFNPTLQPRPRPSDLNPRAPAFHQRQPPRRVQRKLEPLPGPVLFPTPIPQPPRVPPLTSSICGRTVVYHNSRHRQLEAAPMLSDKYRYDHVHKSNYRRHYGY